MRKPTLSVAILALVTILTSVSLADDFSTLFAELNFDDAPSIDQPLAVAEATGPVKLKQIEQAAEFQELDSNPGYGLSIPGMLESNAFETSTAPEVESAPLVALRDPIPASVPEPIDQVNPDDAFTLQDVKASKTETPTQTIGYHCHRIDDHCDSHHCESDYSCMPHVTPNLPSSTLYQYFRSNPCYANVWDGYRRRCGKHHKHLHGECDCFKNSSKRHGCSTSFGCGHKDCVNCDVGCDH